MPGKPLYVPAGPAQSELREKSSRFLAFVFPATSVSEAEAKLTALKKDYFDASHVCFGWVIGRGKDEIPRSSDAGEPKGTAGPSILDAIRGAGLTNALVVVVRYFGGTKLGTGGLSRTYRQAASEALAKAGKKELAEELRLQAPLSLVDRILNLAARFGAEVKQKTFANGMTAVFLVPVSRKEEFVKETEKILGRNSG